MTEKPDPYARGKAAFLANQPESANPYDPRIDERSYMDWLYGWNDTLDAEFRASDSNHH